MARKIGYAVRPIADIQADLDELGNRLSRVATFIRDKVQRAVVYAEPAGHNNRYLLAQARGETRHAELAVSELIDQADKKIDDIVQDVRILLETSFAESTSQALLAKFFPRAVAFLAGGPRAHYHNLKTRFEHLVAQMTDLEKRLPHFEVTSPEEKPPVAPLRGASSSETARSGWIIRWRSGSCGWLMRRLR